MEHSTIPACFFPSTTLFVDESRDFLLSLILQLDEDLAYKSYDSPVEALAYIKQNQARQHQRLSSDLALVHEEIYNPQRFNQISVVVVDCTMPSMDGLEFCQQISDPRIKKILLTGRMNEGKAREAMKAGLIHRHIKKSDTQVVESISRSILELQQEYFLERSESLMQGMSIDLSCLQNRKFGAFFQSLCQEKRIVEYYLLDRSGSFLMLDEDANPGFLIVRTEEDLKQYTRVARRHGMDEEALCQVAKGEKIPCKWPVSASDQSWHEWSDALVPAEQIIADTTWSCAYVQEPVLLELDQDNIVSFYHYMERIDFEELFMMPGSAWQNIDSPTITGI